MTVNSNKKTNSALKGVSRRDFIKAAGWTVGGAGALSMTGLARAETIARAGSQGSTLALAGYRFDRTKALMDGKVEIQGYQTNFTEMGIGDINTHVFSGPRTLDVVEIGLHPYMLAFANDNFREYALLPIFPLRLFRHKSVFIRNDRDIGRPEDLKGKTIATAGYSSTSLTWIRGIFRDEYGVAPEDMTWVISKKDSSAKDAGKVSKNESILPEGVKILPGPEGKDESDLLEAGDVDAVFHVGEPKGYVQGHPKIVRLFPDYRSTERAFFAKTGIFPIMHAVAVRKDLIAGDPELVAGVFAAYSQSKLKAYQYLAKLVWWKDMLPWIGQEFDETRSLMGNNYYSYGIEANRKPLEALFRYSYEQGLCSRNLEIEEIFEPSSLSLTEPDL
jgi:4,5-dihydroxyphthalate decarboxylase